MQISKLKTIVNLSLNDILPTLDIDGGVSGKPKLGNTTIQSIIDLLPNTPGGGGNNSGGFSIPTTIKTVAANNDYFIGIDVDGLLYKITKADLFTGLTSSSGSGGGNTGSSGSGNTIIPTYINIPMLETSGIVASDSSGNSRHGTYTSLLLSSGGATFNGTSSRMSLNAAFDALPALTVSIDFKTNSNAAGGLWEFRASQDLSSGTYAPALILGSDGKLSLYGYPQSSAGTALSYNNNALHRAVASISNGSVKIFVDGAKVIDQAISPIASFTGFFTVGATRAGGYYSGLAKNFRVYNSLLTEQEISTLF